MNSQTRNIVVTGANKGIGYSIVERLISENTPFDIIATSRDPKLGEKAVAELLNKYPNFKNTLTYHQLDINDEKSIDTFVDWLKNTSGKLDVLLNNAGVAYNNPTDIQKINIVKTNFFSVINLTEKLLPLLTADGKIIMVSSILGTLSFQGPTLRNALENESITEQELYDIANNILENIKDYPEDAFLPEASYPASKALLNTYVRKFLQAKLKDNQQSYSLHPGHVETDLTKGFDSEGNKLITPYQGADTPVYLVNLPFVKNSELNGKFFSDRKIVAY